MPADDTVYYKIANDNYGAVYNHLLTSSRECNDCIAWCITKQVCCDDMLTLSQPCTSNCKNILLRLSNTCNKASSLV